MADKYCSAQFKTGEELDAALKAALETCDYSVAASECRQAAEKHRTEAGVSEHNAEVYAEGGKLEAHEGQTVSPEEIPGAKGYMTEARSHKFAAGIQAENAKAYAEGGTPWQDVGDGMFVGGMPTLGAKGYADHAKVYVEGGEAPMTPPELGDGVVRSHGAKNFANMAAAYAMGGSFNQYMPEHGGMVSTTVDKGAMQYAEEARLAAEQAAKGVQDAANSATAAAHSEELAEKYWIAADKARSEAVGANSWAQIYAEEAKKAAESGGGGSGGGGVSGWNDIPDKPFYSEKRTKVLLDESELALSVASNYSLANLNYTNPGVVDGETYDVTWNGAKYTCVAQSCEDSSCTLVTLGEPSGIGAEGDLTGNGEPFCIAVFYWKNGAGYQTTIYSHEKMGTVSVEVTQEEHIEKIDAKCLPESVSSIVLRSSTAGSTKLFRLTIDDGGTISVAVM